MERVRLGAAIIMRMRAAIDAGEDATRADIAAALFETFGPVDGMTAVQKTAATQVLGMIGMSLAFDDVDDA